MQDCSLTWELDSLFPHPGAEGFRAEVDAIRQRLSALADRSEDLPAVTEEYARDWGAYLDEVASALSVFESLSSFVACHAAADAANKLFLKYEGELASFGPLRAKIATNIEFAFQAAEDSAFQAFVGGDLWLSENEFFVRQCRKDASFRLAKDQELLAAELDVDGLHGWGRLYDRISSEVRVTLMERGEIVKKSPGQVTFESPLREVRENNFRAVVKAWSSIADTCADALNHIAGARLTKYKRLGIDHLAMPLHLNRMTRETLDTMWSVISERRVSLQKYLAAKAKLLGQEKLAIFDLEAPVPSSNTEAKKLTYDEACTQVIDSSQAFSEDFGEFAEMAIRKRWIESEDREGKRQGGFCTDFSARQQSRIFMTFTGTVDGMSTLAHEIGHAYHSWVLNDQPLFLRNYPMNLAETASTFSEAVLADKRLSACASSDERRLLLDKMLSDAVAFLMNIHSRFMFEDAFHQERLSGEVSAERLSELMLEAQKNAYCDSFSEDGWYSLSWVSKLHYYITELPFYNFPYTIGYLLSLGTFALAKDDVDFPDKFRSFLVATGCQVTEDAVKNSFGYDLRERDFWDRSLDVVDERVQQFLELC